jgi:hypothetical protein
MAAIKVVDLISRVSITLQDQTYVRWPQQELLDYLNDAQRQITLFRPDAQSVSTSFACVNSAKQTLPSDGLRLISIIRNTNGRAISRVDRPIIDVQLPNWFDVEAGSDGVKHYIYDALDPKVFYVYPKPVDSHEIDIVYAISPAEITISDFDTDTQVIALDDVYANAIMDYMLYRSYQKDSEFTNLNRATVHYQSFQNSLGIKSQADGALVQSMVAQQSSKTGG